MKLKRYKRAQRILGFYAANFNLRAPYKVVVDGTFCQAARENQVNLREQLGKYLSAKTELCATPCVIAELELLGSAVGGALHIASSLELLSCGHSQASKSAQACLLNLAKQAAKGHLASIFVATQDPVLSHKLYSVPGCPILFLRSKTILLRPPAKLSTETAEATVQERIDHQQERLKSLKRAILGETDEELPKKRKRRKKGVNPLACLKKKKKQTTRSIAAESADKSKKKKRRRKSRAATTIVDVNID